jgi:pSer/pThr/pTyr-binding forkhead associated (FHA) protein
MSTMMSGAPQGPHAATAAELKLQIEAERAGLPFLIYRSGSGEHHLLVLDAERERLTLGRRSSADLALEWDDEVSRLHAELVRKGEEWTLTDDGLSMNGSFVNGEPVRGQRRLRDGDALRVGETVLIFRNPRDHESKATTPSADLRTVVALSDAQRRVLAALCRPFRESVAFVTPPSNEQIAAELYLSVDAVKKHLRTLFQKFGVAHLPQNEKRARLVERAFAGGFISDHEG